MTKVRTNIIVIVIFLVEYFYICTIMCIKHINGELIFMKLNVSAFPNTGHIKYI